jgi:ABC-2 type transport system permease protein
MYGLVGAALGLAYVLRAVGDVSSPALSWLSPIGWYQGMHAFSGLRWWPASLALLGLLVTVVAAYWVFDRRDAGAGVLAERQGPAQGGRSLGGSLGLAWRLQRGSVLGWSAGLLFVGLAYGSMGTDIGDLMGDSDFSADLLAQAPGGIVDAFYATAVLMLAVFTTGFAISSALRPRGEEDDGRLEPLLAAPLARLRWLLSHATVTVGGSLLVVLAAGVGLGLGYALVTGDEDALLTYPLALIGYLAPVLVMAAIARLLYGWVPRAASLAWLGLVFVVVVMVFGEVFQLPSWLQDLSPFEHNALVPAEDFRWAPVLALFAAAALLSGLGHWGFTRRDVS